MKALNMKNMKETLVNYSRDQDKFSEIFNLFYQMTCLGFISWKTWGKFAEQCRGWYYDEYCNCIRDERHCQDGVDSIVWEYTGAEIYHA